MAGRSTLARTLPLEETVFLQKGGNHDQRWEARCFLEGSRSVSQSGRGMLSTPETKLTMSDSQLVEHPAQGACLPCVKRCLRRRTLSLIGSWLPGALTPWARRARPLIQSKADFSHACLDALGQWV